MKVVIKTTKTYEKSISKLLSKEKQLEMEDEIASDPLNWPLIKGTGGIRKARFSRDGMGKRGGGRVCYLYITIHEVIYFLAAYAKNEKEDLEESDKKAMKKLVQQIIETLGDV